MTALRKIIHIDMDAFFAAVEQRDSEELRGKPIAVGGRPEGRGVVAAASYEARRFGVRSAMSSAVAQERCPQLIFVPPRIQVYRRISRVVMGILREYSDKIEPLSLDEAYLDVTGERRYASTIAQEIRAKIQSVLGLTASAGVSINKFLAKLASGMAKPNGIKIIQPHQVDEVLLRLTTRAIPGVGRKTEEKLLQFGVHTVRQLRDCELQLLVEHFGKHGERLYNLSRGIDDRAVEPDRERKSLSAEQTFTTDIVNLSEIEEQLLVTAEEVSARLQKSGMSARTITLKITFHDFQKVTRSRSLETPVSRSEQIFELAMTLATSTELGTKPARLLGISTSHLIVCSSERTYEPSQLELFQARV